MFFQLPLIQQKRLYRRCFLINAERERFSHKYGGCGALYIKYQRCPATAAPFESALARALRRAKGKGVKRSSRRPRSSQSPKKSRRAKGKGLAVRSGERAERGQSLSTLSVVGFLWRERYIDIPSPLSPPFVKGRGFLLLAKNNRRSNLFWQGPRGEHRGKGSRCEAASEQSEANPSQHCQKKDATQSLLVAPFQWPRRAFYNLYLKYSRMFPLICISEISHSLVLYSAVRIRSSASRRLFCASRISIPGKSPSR